MNDSPIGVKECRPRRSFTNNTCQVFVEFGSALRLGDEVGMKLVALQEARVMSFRASLLLVQEADRHQKQRPPMVLGIPKEGDPLYTVVLGYIVLLAELVALARLNLLHLSNYREVFLLCSGRRVQPIAKFIERLRPGCGRQTNRDG